MTLPVLRANDSGHCPGWDQGNRTGEVGGSGRNWGEGGVALTAERRGGEEVVFSHLLSVCLSVFV